MNLKSRVVHNNEEDTKRGTYANNACPHIHSITFSIFFTFILVFEHTQSLEENKHCIEFPTIIIRSCSFEKSPMHLIL